MNRETSYRAQGYYGEVEIMHSWTTTDETGTVIAELYAQVDTGQIMQVWVAEAHRGEGLARHLYETATQTVALYHSPAEHCTEDGAAFAAAMGGETIPADLAYDPAA